jgi:hypothetical protein
MDLLEDPQTPATRLSRSSCLVPQPARPPSITKCDDEPQNYDAVCERAGGAVAASVGALDPWDWLKYQFYRYDYGWDQGIEP